MSDLNNIDKLLKDNFVDFAPDAPNVWQGIEQGVQAAQATQAAGDITAAVKGTSLVVKIIATVAIGASVVTGYVLLTEKENTNKQELSAQVDNESVASSKAEQKALLSVTESPIESGSGEAKSISAPSQMPSNQTVIVKSKRGDIEMLQDEKPASEMIVKAQPLPEIKSDEKPIIVPSAVVSSTKDIVKKETHISEDLEETTQESEEPTTDSHPNENSELFIPTVITPNGDGKNDRFVIPIENEQRYFLTIMDKNGNKVFESNDKNLNWDGRDYKSGLMCTPGTYFMIFRYQLKGMQTEQTKIGKVTLL